MPFDVNLYDACMKQADYFAGRLDSRSEFEWKFSVGLWTLLAVGAGFLAGKGHVRWWVVLVPILLHFQWLHGIWVANGFDKTMGRAFPPIAEPPNWYRIFFDWSMRFQLSCTVLLSVILVLLNHIPLPQQLPNLK